MRLLHVRFIAGILFATLMTSVLFAQPAQRMPTPNDTITSPKSLGNGRIMIQIYAPKATEVTVSGDFSGNKPVSLTKNDQGVWTTTAGSLRPDYYTYTLTVDGVRTADPKNPVIKQGISSIENIMLVPGSETAFEDNRAVPHGDMREVWFQSSTLGMARRLHVYTPPGYEKGTTSYPVLYLLHGAGDDDSGWNSIGRAGFILDNLIANGQAKPMIVVMPNGTMPVDASIEPIQRLMQSRKLTPELLTDIIPLVEKTYRAQTSPDKRAIAGLSMGGFQTLDVTLSHPEPFAYVGVFSSGFLGPSADDAETRYAKTLNDASFNSAKKLVWMGIGKDDRAMESNQVVRTLFDKHQINYQFHETSGAHTWINWRQYLHDYASLLFK